jgi:hypothetical protein
LKSVIETLLWKTLGEASDKAFVGKGQFIAVAKNNVDLPNRDGEPRKFTATGLLFVIPASPGQASGARAGIQNLDPGSSPNAVDLRDPSIFIVTPAKAGVQGRLRKPGFLPPQE